MGALHKGFARPDDLLEGDRSGQGGILHQRDHLVGHGRDDPFDHLKQGHPVKYLSSGHAQHEARLLLAHGDALNAAPVDLGEIAGVIDDKGHRRRQEPSGLSAAPDGIVEDQPREKIYDQKLDHQGRSPDHRHKQLHGTAYDLKSGHGAEGDDQPQGDGPQKGHQKEL